MALPEGVEALKHKLEDLEAVSDALWESLERRVENLEGKINVGDSGSSMAPQPKERIAGIEKAQKQLGDAIKCLDKEVKDSIGALRTEVSELAATMKVIMMALGKTPTPGDTSELRGKDEVPEPKPDAGKGKARMGEEDVGKNEPGVNVEASYTEDVSSAARRRLSGLRVETSLRDYLKEFTSIAGDIPEMEDREKLSAFMNGLPWEVAQELQWCGVRSFSEAVSIVRHCPNYRVNIQGPKSRERSPKNIGRSQSRRIGRATSGGEGKKVPTQLHVSSSSHVPTKRSKILKCFLCDGPHKVKDCPQKAALAALQEQVQEEQAGSMRQGEVPKGTRSGDRAGDSRSHAARR